MCLLVQHSLESALSMSSLATHLSILGKIVATISIMFNDVFLKKSNWAFVRCFCLGLPPIFLVIIWCGMYKFVWAYGIDMLLFSSFFSKFVCFFIAFNISVCLYFI